MSSAICFNLDQSKILSSGNRSKLQFLGLFFFLYDWSYIPYIFSVQICDKELQLMFEFYSCLLMFDIVLGLE